MNKIILGVIVIIIIVGGFVFLNKKDDGLSDGGLKIGVISILTGDYAVVGEGWRNGIILAKEEYNKTNPDNQIELVIENDNFDAKTGLSAYKKLTSIDNVDALINASSATIDAIYDLAIKEDFPVIQGGEQGIDPADDNIFQVMHGNIIAEVDLGKYVRARHSEDVALVYTNNDFMIKFAEAFKEGYGNKLNEYVMDPKDKDLKTTVSKIMTKKPSTVVVLAVPEQGSILMKRFSEIVKDKPQIYFDGNFMSGMNDYKRILGGLDYLNGSIIVTIAVDISEEFNKMYKDRFGMDAAFFSDLGYDGFNILIDSYSKDNKKWANNIKNIDFDGVSGHITFDKFGIRKPTLAIKEIKDGEVISVE